MLTKIYIEETELTPLICLDAENNVMKIIGISIPEDATGFYMPVLDWLKCYQKSPNTSSNFVFFLDYYNTSSSKIILEIIKSINKIKNHTIEWRYYSDDEDMKEVAQDIKGMLGIHINEKIITR